MTPAAKTSLDVHRSRRAWPCYRLFMVVAVLIVVGVVLLLRTEAANLYLMRFFRDLSFAQRVAEIRGDTSTAVIMMASGLSEDPYGLLPTTLQQGNGESITADELAGMTGEHGAAIWLSIQGRVYAVDKAKALYGFVYNP